jgi:subtilisin family serine protease
LKKVYRFGVVLLVVSFLLAGCIGGGGDSKKRYSVSGVVQDNQGAPLAGVELKFDGPEITSFVVGPTGEDGKWQADNLKGTVTLEVLDKDGWSFNPKTIQFTKDEENVIITAVSDSEPEYSVSGVVQDGLGIPLAGVELKFDGSEITSFVVGPTGEDGKWQADNLKGTVTLEVLDKDGWFFSPATLQFTQAAENVLITASQGQGLTIYVDGAGEVEQEVIFSPLSTDYYPRTSKIKLTAKPDFDWRFVGWFGDVPEGEEENNPIIVTMDQPKEIGALFVPQTSATVTVDMNHLFPFALEQLFDDGEAVTEASSGGIEAVEAPAEEWEDAYIEDEFIVMMNTSLSKQESLSILNSAGYEVKDFIPSIGAYLVTPKSDMIGAQSQVDHISALETLNGAVLAEQNARRFLFGIKYPNDPYYFGEDVRQSQWWHYDQIRLPQAWAVTTGSKDIRVAVIDTGIDPDHVDLQDNLNVEESYDFTADGDIFDFIGHGTHVAGTIGATTNNGRGVAGVMWDVDLIALKVFDQYGNASSWEIGSALLYAAGLFTDEDGNVVNSNPVDIVNMSLGGPHSEFEDYAVEAATARGVILVAATGNNGRPIISYPAAHPDVIAVGATASGLHLWQDGRDFDPPLAPYSNHGPLDFVVAPGGGGYDFGVDPVYWDFVLSTVPGNALSWYTGTSMASPHVAGVIGLMLSNGIPKSQVREVLERTCMKINDYNEYYYGKGLVNAYWAVNAVEDIRLIQGIREDSKITAAVEYTMPLPETQMLMDSLEAGSYQLIAWVDVNKNDLVDAGDYLSETPVIEFDYGQGWSWWPTLEEFYPDYDTDPASVKSQSVLQLISK